MTSYKLGLLTRKWLFAALCLATFVAGHARMNAQNNSEPTLTASKVFAEAPLEVLDLLRPSTRLDMLDYYAQADSILPAVNALGGTSRLVDVAPDYLKLEVTPISTLEIKLLHAGKKQLVMTLYTVGDETMASDTEVRFFDDQLKPLDAGKYLKAPKLIDFFTLKGSGISKKELMEKVPYESVQFSTGPGETPLTATLTSLRALSQEDRDLLTTVLTPTLSAPWTNKFQFK